MGVWLGGEKAWKQRVTGDIVSSYQWINDEPAMVLWPVKRSLNSAAVVICLSAAHQYTDPEYMMRQAVQFSMAMGMDQTKATVYRIIDIIMDGLPDLVSMPPKPTGLNEKRTQEMIGEASLMADGQKIYTTEIGTSLEEMAGA